MAIFKITYFIKGEQYGWTESYYVSNDKSLAQNLALTNPFAQARAGILSFDCALTFARVSTVGVSPRQTQVRNLGSDRLLTREMRGMYLSSADYASTALLIRYTTDDFTRTKFSFSRGQPDVVVDQAGRYLPTQLFISRMNLFVTELTRQGYGWYGVQAPARSLINSILSQANGEVTFSYLANIFPLLVQNTVVTIRNAGITGCRNLNGPLTVRVLTPSSCQTIRAIPIFPWTGSGRTSFSDKRVIPIALHEVERVVERKAGRPSYLSRGRAKNRVLG